MRKLNRLNRNHKTGPTPASNSSYLRKIFAPCGTWLKMSQYLMKLCFVSNEVMFMFSNEVL